MSTLNNITFSDSAGKSLQTALLSHQYSKVAVLVDENTKEHCYPKIKENLSEHLLIEIASGEVNKTLQTCEHIWLQLTEKGFDRKSLLINLGGGVIGDMGGFCASTFKRGIDFINVPTTLLSQVDASVGGKLGVDFFGFKNHIGIFKEPRMVIIDPSFLKTLPERELRSGYAEIIKHHLIADHTGWQNLVRNSFEYADLPSLIPHSVQIKNDIVTSDPYEDGPRKSLNFGHTVGHAIESYLLNTSHPVLHGEAIAAGMICEAFISKKKELISQEELDDVVAYIRSNYTQIQLSQEDITQICTYLIQDKKNNANTVLAALLNGIGSATWDKAIDTDITKESLAYYEKCYI